MRRVLVGLTVLFLSLGAGTVALAGAGPVGPLECPDYDGDGICNGQDPDYVPGDQCLNPDCLNPDCPNPDCPDADGDGICNGQDPDYVPPGKANKPMLQKMLKIMTQAMLGFGLLEI